MTKFYWLLSGDTRCVLKVSRGECISLPPRMQARLKGEGVSWAWGVVGEAIGLRGEAFQSRGGVSLERDNGEFPWRVLKFWLFSLWANVCAYLQKSWWHGRVVEATQGSRGGRGSETWHPREGQQTREGTASWTLKSTAEPDICRSMLKETLKVKEMIVTHVLIITKCKWVPSLAINVAVDIVGNVLQKVEEGAHMDSVL